MPVVDVLSAAGGVIAVGCLFVVLPYALGMIWFARDRARSVQGLLLAFACLGVPAGVALTGVSRPESGIPVLVACLLAIGVLGRMELNRRRHGNL